jgi:hypothetical protein
MGNIRWRQMDLAAGPNRASPALPWQIADTYYNPSHPRDIDRTGQALAAGDEAPKIGVGRSGLPDA